MKLQYTLLALSAFVLVSPSVRAFMCYTEECQDEVNYTCKEVGSGATMKKERCISPYPDRTPACIKSVHFKYIGGDDIANEGNRRVISVHRRCTYAANKPVYRCTQTPHNNYLVKECLYPDTLGNF